MFVGVNSRAVSGIDRTVALRIKDFHSSLGVTKMWRQLGKFIMGVNGDDDRF